MSRIGLLIGILLFVLFYGVPYYLIFDRFGKVSEFAGLLALVLGAGSAILGGAVEYALSRRKK